ncbi:DUF3592 domain-containing protein [Streptomyces sp. NPDC059398]|uniref:DUF3592 domain-containing protein n=1 Tax=Streptomyces sp. NPDC059398 TaxID=3346820 RepID=UPI0036947A6D
MDLVLLIFIFAVSCILIGQFYCLWRAGVARDSWREVSGRCTTWFYANNQVGMAYEYVSADGETRQGKSKLYSYSPPAAGSEVPVLYDPRRQRRSMPRTEADEHIGFSGVFTVVLSSIWCFLVVVEILSLTIWS